MSPETGLSTIPQFDRGGRFVGIRISLPRPSKIGNERRNGDPRGEKKMIGKSLTAALVVGHLWAGSLHAQSQNPPESIDQIIVTAARTPVSIEQVGSATTVISRAEIERRQARYVTDLLRTVPGIFSCAERRSRLANAGARPWRRGQSRPCA